MKHIRRPKGISLNVILLIINAVLFLWIAAAYIMRDQAGFSAEAEPLAARPAEAYGEDTKAAEPDQARDQAEGKTVEAARHDNNSGSLACPTVDEFSSWYQLAGFTRPLDEAMITERSEIQGSWKGFICYETSNPAQKEIRLLNCDMELVSGKQQLKAHWYSRQNLSSSECISEEDKADTVFTGEIEDGQLVFRSEDSGEVLAIRDFWRNDGKEYALGIIEDPNGTSVTTAMIRP